MSDEPRLHGRSPQSQWATLSDSLLTDAERAAAQEDFLEIGWYDGLDSNAIAAMRMVEARLATTTPIGTPVDVTPAGNYVGLYSQYGRVHAIPAQRLQCTATSEDGTRGTVSGWGEDDVGQFAVGGSYALSRMVLTKRYIPGTGDPHENKGHSVALRLTRCALAAALPRHMHVEQWGLPSDAVGFVGTWHVRTASYRGDAEMCLWLPPLPVAIGHLISEGDEGATPTGIAVPGTVLPAAASSTLPVVRGRLVS